MAVAEACPPKNDLSNYVIGRLPHAGMAFVGDHVAHCSTCQQAIETFDAHSDPLLVELRQLADEGMEAIDAVDSVQLAQAAALVGPAAVGTGAPRFIEPVPERIGAYRLEEQLGQGGMGAVYRATHLTLGKTVAIKLLARERMADAAAQARFHREIRAVGQLRHANIVNATDAGEADGWHYLVMEHVEGWDLSRLVRALGPLPIADACELVRQAALALGHVQARRLVHRDIKPSNLMLTRDGQVKLLDLGLAALLRDELSTPAVHEHDLTQAQQILGTIEYIAPEQLRDSRAVDVRADLYGLGGTLFKLLTGRSPFQPASEQISPLQLAAHHLQTPAPDIRSLRPEVPAALAALVARLLAKQPEDRCASPQELAEALAPLAKQSDLTKLATRAAGAVSGESDAAARSRTSTFAHLSSALSETDTRPLAAPLAAVAAMSPATRTAPERRSPRRVALVALGLLGVIALATVILYVRNTRVEVPDGSEVTVAADGTVRVNPPENTEPSNDPPPQPVQGRTPQLTKFDRTQPGQPLSRIALVARPAEVAGVASWSLETVAHRGDVLALAISPDEKWLASAGKDGAVRIWNLSDGELTAILVGHGEIVLHLAWSPDSQQLLSADQQTSFVWDVASGTRRKLHEFKTDENVGYSDLAWSQPDQIDAAWMWGPAYFHRIDVATGKVHKLFESAEANLNNASGVLYSPDGRNVVVLVGQQVHVLETNTGEVLNKMPAPTGRCFFAWSPDSKRLAFSDLLGVVQVWELRGKKPLRRFGKAGPSPWVIDLIWSPDGRDLIVYGHHGLQSWKVDTSERQSYPGAHAAIHHYCISKTRTYIAAATFDDITVYGEDGKVLWSQDSRQPLTNHVQWSPDGKHLAYTSTATDRTEADIVVTSADDGTVRSRRKHNYAHTYRWSADGGELAICRQGGNVDFDDPLSDQTLRTLATGHEEYFDLRVSPNGKQLATGDGRSTVKASLIAVSPPA